MLVLTRQAADGVVITDGDKVIRLKVVQVRGGQVKLGFEAPPGTEIRREELPPRSKAGGESCR